MSYIALYREWRPAVFEDVVEQEHVVRTLRHSVSTGRVAHAYLFCGTRGTGKTTMAHILSRAINCLHPNNGDPCNECEVCREILSGSSTDVLEIDAASNNSVDNVREIRDEVVYAPSRAKYKVYIIDEVHMLSTGAFNALLKTLEEPPAHVVFILATTEPHKLPATILSRCQRFDFRRITLDSIAARLDKIASAKGVKLAADAARLIARMSEGALRDAISLMDQCMSLGGTEIAYDEVLSVVGIVNDTFMAGMVDDIIARNVPGLLGKVNTLVMDGQDIPHFISDLVLYFRNLLICSVVEEPSGLTDVPTDILELMKRQSRQMPQDSLISTIRELSLLESNMKWAASPRVLLEVTLVKLCENSLDASSEALLNRIEALEARISSGSFPVAEGRSPSVSYNTPGQSADGGAGAAVGARAAAGAGAYSASGLKTSPGTYSITGSSAAAVSSVSNAGNDSADAAGGKAAKGGSDSAALVQFEKWKDIMDYLKSLGRRSLHSFLLGSKAVLLEDNIIGIISDNGFVKTAVSKPENLEVLEGAAKKVLGYDVRVSCIDQDAAQSRSARVKEPEKDELVEKARSIADRAGVPFDIIDG